MQLPRYFLDPAGQTSKFFLFVFTIVATHHVPTRLNYPAEYKDSDIREVFVTELYDLIKDSAANFWIYRHHHRFFPDFQTGKTILATNQLGYVHYGEHKNFDG